MNQSGGDSDKLYTILQLEKILYLPKSNLFIMIIQINI